MILLKDGWYEEEFDGKRPYSWSSDRSSISIEQESDKNAIRFFAGTDSIDRVLKFILDDNVYECDVSEGWVNYYIPYGNESEMIIEIEPLNIEEDDRNLGIMVSMIESINLEKNIKEIYITPEIVETYQTKDTTVFEIEKLKSPYVDIIYSLDVFASKVRLDEITSGHSQIFELIKGENNSLSYETKSKNNLKFSLSVPSGSSFKVKSVVNRENYYDFLNISSIVDYKDNERKWMQKYNNNKLVSIQWFVSWKCNYKCSYCWQEVAKDLYRRGKTNTKNPEEWAKVFNKLNPDSLYFTGGEPTLYRKLPELINLINDDIILSITTNFSETLDLDNWIEKVPRGRFGLFFLSCHPTEIKSMDNFYKKVDKYLEHYGNDGFGIEMVVHKDTLHESERLIEFCQSRDIMSALDPFIPPTEDQSEDRVSGEKVKEMFGDLEGNLAILRYEKEQLSGSGSFDTSILKNRKSSTFNHKILVPQLQRHLGIETKTTDGRLPLFCPAGRLRINVDDMGDVYTCMSAIDRSKLFGEHSMPHYKSLGNLFDGTYKRLTKPVICWESFRCSACDVEAIEQYWEPFDEDFDWQLPIPE